MKIDEILNFWLQGLNDSSAIDPNLPSAKRWFVVDPLFDQTIKANFEMDLIKAKSGEYRDWEKTIKGRLALIILLDQFSRNLYRRTPKMYEGDNQALDLVLCTIQEGRDQELSLIERVFLYMPLMHAEDVATQHLSVQSFERLIEESKERAPLSMGYFEYNLKYAKAYLSTIERFGRFPHRNETLNRRSTPEEEQFLTQKV